MQKMIEVKTAELEGAALDWAVAVADSKSPQYSKRLGLHLAQVLRVSAAETFLRMGCRYCPSTDWSQGGPLIDKYNIQTSYNGNGFSRSKTGKYWCAYVCKENGLEEKPSGGGPTPLIAACRAIVAAKLGDSVSVPAELLA